MPCAASRQTVKRSALAGHAGYGYCKSHHRCCWGFRLYVRATPDGLPVAWCPATAKRVSARWSAAVLGTDERSRPRPGLRGLSDKGFAGREFEQLLASHGAVLLRPDRADAPHRLGSLGRWRQRIESTFDTLKDQLGLERRRRRTLAGVYGRVGPAAARLGRRDLVELADRARSLLEAALATYERLACAPRARAVRAGLRALA